MPQVTQVLQGEADQPIYNFIILLHALLSDTFLLASHLCFFILYNCFPATGCAVETDVLLICGATS